MAPTILLAFLLTASGGGATGNASEAVADARKACRTDGNWPELQPEIAGCPIDWDNPESVTQHFVRPASLNSPAASRAKLPANEEVRSAVLFLEYLISEEGSVVDVCVLKSVSPTVDAHYVGIAKEAKYSPATLCGKRVPASSIVMVRHHAWNWPRK